MAYDASRPRVRVAAPRPRSAVDALPTESRLSEARGVAPSTAAKPGAAKGVDLRPLMCLWCSSVVLVVCIVNNSERSEVRAGAQKSDQ